MRVFSLGLGLLLTCRVAAAAAERPNILWLTVEDMSANLGCYGDEYADTPNLDAFAGESVRYTHAFATAPVCSPSRACLITGVYATSLGAQRLRSAFPIPVGMEGFPALLRKEGYYCTNNVKTDYNTANEEAIKAASWDDSSATAHWRGRKPGQPFFAVFNDANTHQSRSMVWPYEGFRREVQSRLSPDRIHDPDRAPVPAYYPDTPVVRRTLARYYDCISVMDQNVGTLLRQLEEDGLAENTIVFFYADHGAGLPRHKRVLLDSGMHVPLMIRFPKAYQHLAPAAQGETTDRLVSFVDFPVTVLCLLEMGIPGTMQGKPFLGPAAAAPRDYVYGARDRVDEAYDLARSVRDKRYLYIRNFMPHLSYNQPSAYSDRGEIRDEIYRLAAEGSLSGPAWAYAGPVRPLEELYDTWKDPANLHNLAQSPEHRDRLTVLRNALGRWMEESRDLGFLPEADAWARLQGDTPFDLARQPARYPQAKILEAASLVGQGKEAVPRHIVLLEDPDPAVRYWGAVGLRAANDDTAECTKALAAALDDDAPSVRIEAAGALAAVQDGGLALKTLVRELNNPSQTVILHACRTLELLGPKAREALPAMRDLAARSKEMKGVLAMFIQFSSEAFLAAVE